ncbi:MAG: hypothetical protein KGH60_03250 [Candidatus Micrarchaeota archaeon]|nr:hypothetical protein [Candidatus Micrarchaeota archaeon]
MGKTGLLNALAPAMLMVMAGIAFSYMATGLYGAVVSSAAALPTCLVLYISERLRLSKAKEGIEAEQLVMALTSIYSDVSARNLAMGSAIGNAIKKAEPGSATRKALGAIADSIGSGSMMHEALQHASASRSRNVSTAMSSLASEYSKSEDSLQAIKTLAQRLSCNISEADEKAAGAQQRNITMSMAVSTVLPSFALFAFVGYSIVNYSAAKLSLFSALMLVVIPGIYSMIRSAM